MRRMLAAWDEHLADTTLPRTLTAALRAAGFEQVRMDAYAFANNDLNPESYAGFLVPFIGQFLLDRDSVDEREARAWADEQRELDRRGEFYFAVTQFCFSARRPA